MNLKTLALTFLVLLPLALGNASAADPTITVTMDKAAYSVVDTLVGGQAPVATILVTTDVDGEAVPNAGAAVTVTFLRQVQFVGFVSSESVTGITDANGVLSVAAPQLSGAPGTYMVAAFAVGTAGSTTYSVGA